ncbi:MAG TPA: DinB family protein [Pyrinomonadaceae bacterium]|nr:DinB family protein [Pyrinomonadaceae bacterium]
MKDALEDFRGTLEAAQARLLAITEDESEARSAQGRWSPKEIIGHLIDSAANNHQRFVRAQLTDELVFPGYEQSEWVAVQHYQQASWPALIQLWLSYNLHLLHLVSHIPESKLKQLRGKHNLDRIAWQTVSTSEPVTLEYFIRDYINHLKHHLQQIFSAERTNER